MAARDAEAVREVVAAFLALPREARRITLRFMTAGKIDEDMLARWQEHAQLGYPGTGADRMSAEPTSFDIIMLIHKATLELYGLKLNLEKSLPLAELLEQVATGERTFIDSDSEEFGVKFRANFKERELGLTFEEFMQHQRAVERNAARRLRGLPI